LDPSLAQHAWTWEEDQILKKCYIRFGHSWEYIAKHLPGRSANQIKNRIRKKEFQDLFQRSTDNGATPTRAPRYSAATIEEEGRSIEVKKEQNHKRLQQEIQEDLQKDIIEEVPFPPKLQKLIEREKRYKPSKTKRFAITMLHLHGTYKLIRERLANHEGGEFYALFENKNKREIFTKIKNLQWMISQLWPLVTNRVQGDTMDQEISLFLYCLVKSGNLLANSIFLTI
jgi:hypothetical protein